MPAGTEYRKYGPTSYDACPHWHQIPISDDDGDRIIAITLTDRGIDDDENITANGVIVDDCNPSLPMTKKGDPGSDGSGTSPGRSHDLAGGDRGWGVTRRAPDRTIEVADATSCRDVGAPCYGYLIDGGSS